MWTVSSPEMTGGLSGNLSAMGRRGERKVQNHKVLVDVGRNIQRLMSSAELSTKEISKRTGIGESTVKRMRNGTHNATLNSLGAIADLFGVSPFELLVDRGAPMLHGSEIPRGEKAEHSVSSAKRNMKRLDKL